MGAIPPKKQRFNLRLTAKSLRQIDDLARELEMSKSDAVRYAIRDLHRRTFVPFRPGSKDVEDD